MKTTICLYVVAAGLLGGAGSAAANSLYREQRFQAPGADRKASRVGDGVTVLVLEAASASASSGTSTDRSTGLDVKIAVPHHEQKTVSAAMDDDFSGKGKIERSGKLLAQVTVTVQSVEPNGDLNVKGEQQLLVNDEKQVITLEGRIRRLDISESNTVPSNRLANARISYVGDGILGDTQKPGIGTRILRWLGL